MTEWVVTWFRKNRIIGYLLVVAAVIGSYLIVSALQIMNNRFLLILILRVIMGCMGLVMLDGILQKKGEDKIQFLLVMVVLCGIILRIGYMLYTDVTLRSYDMGYLEAGAGGKAGYLLTIIQEKRLPQNYDFQAYQQPFLYLTGGAFSILINAILGRTDNYSLVDASKTVPCVASCLILFLTINMARAFHLKEKGVLAATALVAFTPAFLLSGGRLSEDAPTAFFLMLEVLCSLYWYDKPDRRHTVMLGIAYGLGMMTKISCSVAGIFTFVMLAAKWKKEKDVASRKRILQQVGGFLLISCPLGLWYSIRNAVRFGQSFQYVMPQDVNGPLYRGDISLIRRFFSIDLLNLLREPYAEVANDYNLPAYLLKSELFGEFHYIVPDALPVILLFTSVVMTAIILVYGAKICLRKSSGRRSMAIFGLALLFLLFSGYAYYGFPFGCSMDFRYYLMITIGKAMLLGKIWSMEQETGSKQAYITEKTGVKRQTDITEKTGASGKNVTEVLTGILFRLEMVFCVFSVLIYTGVQMGTNAR